MRGAREAGSREARARAGQAARRTLPLTPRSYQRFHALRTALFITDASILYMRRLIETSSLQLLRLFLILRPSGPKEYMMPRIRRSFSSRSSAERLHRASACMSSMLRMRAKAAANRSASAMRASHARQPRESSRWKRCARHERFVSSISRYAHQPDQHLDRPELRKCDMARRIGPMPSRYATHELKALPCGVVFMTADLARSCIA